MKEQNILAYVVVDSNTTVEQEISDGSFFNTIEEASKWIDENDPKKEFAYDIYSVDVKCVKSL